MRQPVGRGDQVVDRGTLASFQQVDDQGSLRSSLGRLGSAAAGCSASSAEDPFASACASGAADGSSAGIAARPALRIFRPYALDEPDGASETGELVELESAVDQAVAACDGDTRAAVRALLVTLDTMEREIEVLKIEVSRVEAAVSGGYVRGRLRSRDKHGEN